MYIGIISQIVKNVNILSSFAKKFVDIIHNADRAFSRYAITHCRAQFARRNLQGGNFEKNV